MPNKITIYRPDISQYQCENFQSNEERAVRELGFHYSRTLDFESKDVIVISTSQGQPYKIQQDLRTKNIKLWIHPNSGYDNFSKEFIENLGADIIIGNTIRANAVAMYTIQSLLDSLGKIPFSRQWDKNREFRRPSPQSLKTLIIGDGHISKKVANVLENLDFNFDIYDKFKGHLEPQFKDYDIIILLCSLNSSSQYILNENNFEQLKDNVTIINPARGKLINEEALINFLEKKPLAQAYLDVFEEEPHNLESFAPLRNIHTSSHIAGVYNGIDDSIIDFEIQVLSHYLQKLDLNEQYKNSILRNRIIDGVLI